MTKTKEMIVDLEKQVNDKDFKGLTLKSQKDLVFLLSMIYDDREELRVQREEWAKEASKYQTKYFASDFKKKKGIKIIKKMAK